MSDVVLVTLALLSAPVTPYGGEVDIVSEDGVSTTDALVISSAVDSSYFEARAERLYEIDSNGALVPSLAADLPKVDGSVVRVPLRHDVLLHDGRPLDGALLERAIEAFANREAAHVLLPVKGGRERIAGTNGALGVSLSEDKGALLFDLVEAYPPFPRLLASLPALLTVKAKGGAVIGTGPFAPSERDPARLVAFLGHRRGRPFLDSIAFSARRSAFRLQAEIKRNAPLIAIDYPGLEERPSVCTLPSSLAVLWVGERFQAANADAHETISREIQRERLVSRFMKRSATPVIDLLGGTQAEPAPRGSRGKRTSANLIVSKSGPLGTRFQERLQLDLLKAGVSARIERVSPDRIRTLRSTRDFDLLLDVLYLGPVPPEARPNDRLHYLMALAAHNRDGLLDLFPSGTLGALSSRREARAALAGIERRVRERLGIIPIAMLQSSAKLSGPVRGTACTSKGGVRLDDAHLDSGAAL